MEFTDEQWRQFMHLIVKTDSAALMMETGDVKYPHPKREQQSFDMALHKYDPQYKPHIMAARVGRRVAIALIAALLAAAMTIMTVSAAREWFINLVRDIFPGEHVTAEIIPGEDTPEFMVYAPSYLPDGYELTDRSVRELHGVAHLTYLRGGDKAQKIKLSTYQGGTLKYDHSGDEVGTVEINGDEATYSRKGDRQMMGWTDGLNMYRLTCYGPDVTKDEMIMIAESVMPEQQ